MSPSRGRREVLARQDWQPVSAMAWHWITGVGREKREGSRRAQVSDGMARMLTSTIGCGSEARFSQAHRNSLYTWCSSWIALSAGRVVLSREHSVSKTAVASSGGAGWGGDAALGDRRFRLAWRQTASK